MPYEPIAMNRTFLIALGDAGQAILEAFHKRRRERQSVDRFGKSIYPIASLALVTGADRSDNVPVIQFASSDASRPEVSSALDEHLDEVTAGIATALADISQVQRNIDSSRRLRSREVDVYLLAALDDPMAGIITDIAYLVRQLINQRVNARVKLSGLLLLPNSLTSDDPGPALVQTYAALRTINAYLGSHDGYQRIYTNGDAVSGWGPVFNGDCLLNSAQNQDGLGLGSTEARHHLIAETLLQLITSPLGRTVSAIEPTMWYTDGRPTYAGLGITSFVHPAQIIHERLAQRLAYDVLVTWSSKPTHPPNGARAVAFLTDNNLDPKTISNQLLSSSDPLSEVDIGFPLQVDLAWDRMNTLRTVIDEAINRRAEVLEAQRDQLEQEAEACADDLSRVVEEEIKAHLDRPRSSGLRQQLMFLEILREELLALANRETERALELKEALQAADDDVDDAGSRLDQAGAKIADYWPTTWRDFPGLFLRPPRWLELGRLRETIEQAKMTYTAHRERRLDIQVELLRANLVARYLETAAAYVEHWEQQVTDLLNAVETAAQELEESRELQVPQEPAETEEETSPRPPCSLAPLHDLEWPVLTKQHIEDLYAELVNDLAEELSAFADTQARLSSWLAPALDPVQISQAAFDYAQNRLQSILDNTVTRMLIAHHPDIEEQREEIEKLIDMAVPFIAWDETALCTESGENTHQNLALGTFSQDTEFVEDILEDSHRSAPVVSTADPYRMVVLNLVRGIPLAAIPIVQVASEHYAQASDPIALHADPSEVDLPDPLKADGSDCSLSGDDPELTLTHSAQGERP